MSWNPIALNALGTVAAVVGVALAGLPLLLTRGRRTMLRRRLTQSLETRALLPAAHATTAELAEILIGVAAAASEELIVIEKRWVIFRPIRVVSFRFTCVMAVFLGISIAGGRFSKPDDSWWFFDYFFGFILLAWVGPAMPRAAGVVTSLIDGVRMAWHERRREARSGSQAKDV